MRRFLTLWLIVLALSWYPAQAARTFVASSTALTLASAVVSPPFTVCAWFKSNSQTQDQAIWSMGHSSTAGSYHRLGLIGTSTDALQMVSRVTTSTSANSTTTYTAGVWQHACGSVTTAGSTARWVYLNGGSQGTNTGTQAPTVNQTAIGRRAQPTGDEYFRGELEHVAVWNVELSAAEVLALSQGLPPRRVRPGNLVSYVPVWGVNSPELDVAGARSWTLVGTPAQAAGAPVMPLTR